MESDITSRISNSIYMDSPTHNEILTVILSLKNNKAVGDNHSIFFSKNFEMCKIPYLNFFLQFILNNGIFRNNCQPARVALVYKNKKKEEANDYHPSQFFVLFLQNHPKKNCVKFFKFFVRYKVIYSNHFGFQKAFQLYMPAG